MLNSFNEVRGPATSGQASHHIIVDRINIFIWRTPQ
uniref:Uncharacterized protein n=1 Tax=Podoviridae sp. ctaNW81 TaxID=2826562 RepID=A0A8S5M5P4_9CAUD|nr:MAG TPA: hypothetical protein [Podoviridae sp. ctaNW81]